jgi:TolB-like protein/Flp pilus assembly protein TadD
MTTGAADPSGLSGRTISHFRVLEPLGAGGMGVVYRAEDLRLNRTVALKFMLPGYAVDQEATARFLREARSVGALDHPNICNVHEVGESEDRQLFLAMSYYTGETLRDRLTRSGPLPVTEALDIASQIARGLACAHAAGIVHRDLKPANVMLTPDGTVKILDFGLAKARDQTMTVSGVAMGTVAYMAPEQLFGERVDGRTDLWSLGVVLFEMLTGQHPSRGDDAAHTLTREVESHHPRPLNPEVSGSLRRVVDRLLRRNPDERHQTADALLSDLNALRERLTARAEPAVASSRDPLARVTRTGVLLGGVAVLALIGTVLGVLRWQGSSGARDGRDAGRSVARPAVASLAVLPLKNYAGPDQEYFADGMTEELTSTLTKIEALRVIAHQSVAQFKRSDRPVPEIAQLLDVKYVVDGSVRQDNGRVRINASLIDAARNAPVWSDAFDRDRRDVMELQREVALAIAQAIQVTLSPQDRTRLAPTRAVDPEAFELYIKGTQARYDANFSGDFTEATRYLSDAIAKDSGYAPAYAGLAFIHAFTGDQTQARAFARKALALDPKLAEAHMVDGVIRQFFDWDWTGTERAYREALALNPGYAEAHHELSMLFMRQKRFDEAVHEAQLALYLAPTSLRFLNGVGEVAAYGGRPSDALAIADRILASDSAAFSGGFYIKGIAFERMGRLADAEKAWRSCLRVAPKGCDFARANLGYIYAATGRRTHAIQVLDTLKGQLRKATDRSATSSIALDIATVYAGLGNKAEALDWLERGVEGHALLLYLGIEPAFQSLANEPRFQALLKRIGLPTS